MFFDDGVEALTRNTIGDVFSLQYSSGLKVRLEEDNFYYLGLVLLI